ncbi:hypothetical protein SVI_0421 [Shewanella violacea DSS12]|uniref:Uncharacterized protein n=1 Tax=Shewanella violacea (strain JCM 10179 / CIP 106290 / LMG 19151 / DSS12) TaxID=637905 RepID=D4ZF12_SHEVD|nr:hypothetical protein SVI_0421 [Shewanella violacea DSS12]
MKMKVLRQDKCRFSCAYKRNYVQFAAQFLSDLSVFPWCLYLMDAV